MSSQTSIRQSVASSLERSPVVGVVRTKSTEEAAQQARSFIAGGLELVEVTFSVPGAVDLVRALLAERGADGPAWIGMGTVTTADRADAAIEAGAEFLVSPNASSTVAVAASRNDSYLILGALSATEIVTAHELGADIVKVYPLPPVGGAAYLSTVRQPLDDIPMLAAGGFGVDEIPQYRAAGASAYGIGGPLIGSNDAETAERIQRALELARGSGES